MQDLVLFFGNVARIFFLNTIFKCLLFFITLYNLLSSLQWACRLPGWLPCTGAASPAAQSSHSSAGKRTFSWTSASSAARLACSRARSTWNPARPAIHLARPASTAPCSARRSPPALRTDDCRWAGAIRASCPRHWYTTKSTQTRG